MVKRIIIKKKKRDSVKHRLKMVEKNEKKM